MPRYNPKESEPRWREAWTKAEAFQTTHTPGDDRPKYYGHDPYRKPPA